MYFIGSEACRRAIGVIVGVLDVEKVCIPVMLVFVANQSLYFCHVVVDTFDAIATTRRVGACRESVYTEGKGVHPSHFDVRCELMVSTFAMVWLTRSTPPLPLGE